MDGVRQSGVAAIMNYQHKSVEAVATYRDGGGSDGELVGADWHAQEVMVRDGRRSDVRLDLDKHGFCMLGARTPLPTADYYDEEKVSYSSAPSIPSVFAQLPTSLVARSSANTIELASR